jgi:predicted solute-binding protein
MKSSREINFLSNESQQFKEAEALIREKQIEAANAADKIVKENANLLEQQALKEGVKPEDVPTYIEKISYEKQREAITLFKKNLSLELRKNSNGEIEGSMNTRKNQI